MQEAQTFILSHGLHMAYGLKGCFEKPFENLHVLESTGTTAPESCKGVGCVV